jgi:transposase
MFSEYNQRGPKSVWERCLSNNPGISLEVSTSGKYVARKLRGMGCSIHLADPSKLSLIFNTGKKNPWDQYKLAKLLRFGALLEVHLPSRYSDDLRSLIRYRRSLGEGITMLKNKVHAILTSEGISIDATDIFGKKG